MQQTQLTPRHRLKVTHLADLAPGWGDVKPVTEIEREAPPFVGGVVPPRPTTRTGEQEASSPRVGRFTGETEGNDLGREGDAVAVDGSGLGDVPGDNVPDNG